MRQLLFFLLCSLSTALGAQVSTTFILPDTSAADGSTLCIPVTTEDFTAGIEFSFAIQVDPDGALNFNRVQNLNPSIPNFGMEDFNLTDFLFEGIITVDWRNYGDDQECFEAPSVVTLEDGAVLFEACYDVSGGVTSFHTVEFVDKDDSVPFDGMDDSVPIVFNKRPQCSENFDAFPGIVQGSVTVGVDPLILSISEQAGVNQPGDTYCVDIFVESGFEELQGTQYGMLFDSSVLTITSIDPNPELMGNSRGRYNDFETGNRFFSSWSIFSGDLITVEDGFRLVTVCFEVVGDCGTSSPISIGEIIANSGSVRATEASGSEDFVSIPIIGRETFFEVANCNPRGFDVIVDCPEGQVNFGETNVCVEIQAGDDFIEMTRMNYAISWDANLLDFVGVQETNSSLLINEGDDFIRERTDEGLIFFDWEAVRGRGVSLSPGEQVYTLCFNVIGFGGTSPITVGDFRNANESATQGAYNGLNPTNCAINIERPGGIAIYFPESTGFRASEDRCIDVTADGFDGVTDFDLYITSPLALIDYRDFLPAFPGVTVSEPSPGVVQLSYSGTPVTVADGSPIGTLCYRARTSAEPGTCAENDSLRLTPDITLPNTILTTESPVASVPIRDFPGEVCVLFPNGFGIQIADAEPELAEEFCVPVRVNEFVEIRNAYVQFTFDPSLVTFDRVNITPPGEWPGLTLADFDVSRSDIGLIDLNFDNGATGVTNPGGDESTQVFELCFTAGTRDDCFELAAQPNRDPSTVTDEGNGSIVVTPGEICVQDRIVITSIEAIDASCSGTLDGEIRFTTAARDDGARIFIRADNPIRFGRDGRLTGLRAGEQNYVIYTEGGGVREEGTITINVDPENAAVADAGPDRQFPCNGPQRVILQSRNNSGETYRLLALDPNGTTRFVENGDVLSTGAATIIVEETGRYLLEVTSGAGCVDVDTVNVMAGERPVAIAGEDMVLGCGNDEVILDGGGSSRGGNVTYLWERITATGEVIDTASRNILFATDQPGRYRLTVTFADLNCSSSDEVFVDDDAGAPPSSLSRVEELSCNGDGVLLSVGEFDTAYLYSWYELELGPGFPLSAANTFFVEEPGTFIVEIEDTINLCIRMDTVTVMESGGFARVTFPGFLTLDCDTDETLLEPLYLNVDDATRYTWFTEDGDFNGADINSPTVRVRAAGTYSVAVTNAECTDTFSTFIGEAILPEVEAGGDVTIGCSEPAVLEGSGMSAQGNNLRFSWTFETPSSTSIGDTPEIMVSEPGVYYLRATNESTGCSNVDSTLVLPADGFPEYDLSDTIGGLGCDPASVELSFNQLGSEEYTFVWLDPAGNEISTAETAEATSSGRYSVRVTNPATGCSSTDEVFVEADATQVPNISLQQDGTVLTCDQPEIDIDASGTTGNGELSFAWMALGEGQDLSGVTEQIITITEPGAYRLTVTNVTTNCSSLRDFTITEDRETPGLTINSAGNLDCQVSQTSISIDIDGDPVDYEIIWTSPFVPDLPMDVTTINVTEGGTYTVVIINRASSCTAQAQVTIEDSRMDLPTIRIADVDGFGCDTEFITIDASASDLDGVNPDSIRWQSLDGGTVAPATGSATVVVDAPGRYALLVTTATGCQVQEIITVESGGSRPMADAGTDISAGCGEMPQLNGSGSSPAPSEEVSYVWSVLSGPGEIISGADGTMPFVSGAGVFQLVVTNLAANCADTASVTVSIADTEPAVLPGDFTTCGDTTVIVQGNLPAGTTGEWITLASDSSEVSFAGATASITELGGRVTLVWTLSQPECPNYSSDTITVSPLAPPTANDDQVELDETQLTRTVDLLANDNVLPPFSVSLLNDPEFGTVTLDSNGMATVSVPEGTIGMTTVTYEVCALECGEQCATATLRITVTGEVPDAQIYNAISPNGDGLNDVFVFEVLEQRAADYPNAELVVFNRWGDIVYDAQPYANDWGGTANGGSELPAGTYYYVLRLSIGEGEIIRGDVTIVR